MRKTQSQPSSLKTPQTKALASLLVAREMTVKSLAPLTGLTYRTLLSSISNGVPEILFRYRIESALGWLPIWSTAREAEMRRQCFLRFGFDPRLVEVPCLLENITRIPMRPVAGKNKAVLVDAIFQFIAANPNHTAP